MSKNLLEISLSVDWNTALRDIPGADTALQRMNLQRFCENGALIPLIPVRIGVNIRADAASRKATLCLGRHSGSVDAEAAWKMLRSPESLASLCDNARAEPGAFGSLARVVDLDRWRNTEETWDEDLLERQAALGTVRVRRSREEEERLESLYIDAVRTAAFPHPLTRTWVPTHLEDAWKESVRRVINARFVELLLPEEAAADKVRSAQMHCAHAFESTHSGFTMDDGGYLLICKTCGYWLHSPQETDPYLPPSCTNGHGPTITYRGHGDYFHCSRCAHLVPKPA